MNGIGKAVSQLVATILAAVVPLLVDGSLSKLELLNLGLLLLSTLLVTVVPNLSAGVAKYAKEAVAIGLAVLTLLVTFVGAGTHLGASEWIQLALAALGAIGVIGFSAPKFPATKIVSGNFVSPPSE